MNVGGINLIDSLNFDTVNSKTSKIESDKGFGDFLKESLDKVNGKLMNSDEITQKAVLGEVDNVHDVLIAAEEARLSLELTVQIRNKIVEAYQEINRMQI